MSDKLHIERNTVQETLVIPLYGRKFCNDLFPEIYHDSGTEELVSKLDYDFASLEKKSSSTMTRFGILEIAMRQSDLANEVNEYLRDHPRAAVVNLGCGLDQTGENCDNGICHIYNVDFPDVIEIRSKLIGERERVTNVAADLNDHSWFDKIDAADGAVFFASGVLCYLTKENAQSLIKAMNKAFPKGRLVFDSFNKTALKIMLNTWVKQADIKDVGAYFYVGDIEKDLLSWHNGFKASYKGYMLGYQKLEGKNITGMHQFLARVGDHMLKMKIVRIDFQ